ncbi:MAG: LamG domain-containing protein [Planctomycetota bacterium]
MLGRVFTSIFVLALIGTVNMVANVANAQLVEDGLVSYWSFDEIDGDTVVDGVGDNDGTIMGKPKVVDGKVGKALQFNGANDFIDIPGTDSLDFNGKTQLSAAAWVNIEGHSGSCCDPIVAQRDAAGWALRYDQRDGGAEIEFIVHNPAWVGDGANFGAPVPKKGEWHFITGVLTGDEIFVYIDDKLESEIAFAGNIISNSTETEIAGAVDGFFMGIIDEVLIYDKALSEKEVQQNFAAEGFAVDSMGKLATRWAEIKVKR